MKANTYRESLDSVLARCSLLGAERVFFREIVGRVLAQNLTAKRDDPPAPKSAMDGFALRSADTAGATEKRPVRFAFDEVVGAGHQAEGTVTAGGAIRVMTGALLPVGADAVVKQEDTVSQKPAGDGNPSTSGRFAVTAPLAPGENVFPTGSRFARDDVLVPAGIPLNSQALGLFAGEGREDVHVFRRPLVVILALGDELVEPGRRLEPGQIFVSNLYALEAEAVRYGAETLNLGIVGDDPAAIRRRLRRYAQSDGSGRAHIVVTIGGSHQGDFDYVGDVQEGLGGKIHFRRTRINLGGSTVFGTVGETLMFGLPGTPLVSWGAFELLVRPAIWKMGGRRTLEHRVLQARLGAPLTMNPRRPGRAHFIPAMLEFEGDGPPRAFPLTERPTGSHPTATLADGLIAVPEDTDSLAEGDSVPVWWLQG